jgi:hypothetical protein
MNTLLASLGCFPIPPLLSASESMNLSIALRRVSSNATSAVLSSGELEDVVEGTESHGRESTGHEWENWISVKLSAIVSALPDGGGVSRRRAKHRSEIEAAKAV